MILKAQSLWVLVLLQLLHRTWAVHPRAQAAPVGGRPEIRLAAPVGDLQSRWVRCHAGPVWSDRLGRFLVPVLLLCSPSFHSPSNACRGVTLVPFPARFVDTGKLPLTLDSCLRGND